MNIPRHHKKLSTGIALLMLALGFTSLGLLAFINKHPEGAADTPFSETIYSVVGSATSILLGATFLVVAVLSTGTLRGRNRYQLFGNDGGQAAERFKSSVGSY